MAARDREEDGRGWVVNFDPFAVALIAFVAWCSLGIGALAVMNLNDGKEIGVGFMQLLISCSLVLAFAILLTNLLNGIKI